MSRTYRKPRWVLEESKENYIKNNITTKRWHYEYIMTTEGQKKYEKALEIYEENLSRWHSGFPVEGGFSSIYQKPMPIHYKKQKVVYEEVDIEAEIEYHSKRYDKFSRDGWWNETGRNKLYKEWSTACVRNANKRLERKILKDEDYDHLSYPNYYMAKHLAWSVW